MKFYLTEENEKTIINNQYDIITSTIDDLYLQSEYFNRQIASKNNIGYKILKRNRLVLSPQNAWMGNVNLNFKYGIGIVSPSYKVYNLQNCDLNFFAQFVKSDIFISILDKNSQTGASVVRKSLNVKSLLDTELQLPTLEEQKIYGDLFNNLEKQLGLLLKQIKYYTEQKQALMQKFLNGKIRVKTSRKGDDYESRI
ncbi:MAG: hypothetical protein A2Y45_01520 [Tenericutes bacterium GWC2_34_14]|nr:MAG: hypothetical protein A2Z84_04745 [Tenericutes bacterium GWA2_35_7]OHE28318.1 MAG: hypothetical protein A2Y45_01520 [Tenericutes bacterium GWC2_34_14]OHE33213.1 MAG: hypothetical protein A2012_00560 [Tenericutes bacterium GWE2_34_108]OHE36333.1 MAG: hypothetical protein A2Y46_07550 [Tenericutes bacterium GWF1_35_14]OHE38782.1 MAG: hypothetical protein A2Y44_04680 [Tenericutes bacterium GWF2_35_184]OHE44875.1 MAG: hypothetical protein A2221_01215 [Tenericutes bacterium RIFOXYA2_FULL_36_3